MNETKQMTIEQQAFAFHVNGYAVMPIKKDKRPALASWKRYQTEYPTDDEVLSWFNENTDFNIGIVTGKISNISVVDIDNKNGQEQADAMLKRFPETFTVQTGNNGYHLYYQYHEGLSISANAYPDLPNVDIRSDGGFVVAPPSVTSYDGKGGEYRIINNKALAPFPIHLFPQKKPKKTITEMTTAPKGERNNTLASFAGKLLQAAPENEWYTEVLPAVERANLTYTPPLSLEEVRTTFESIARKERENRAGLIISPIQLEDGQEIPATAIKLRKNGNGVPHKDMANVLIVLSTHPFYKDTIRYNTFKHDIEYNGKPIEDTDLAKIQHFCQASAGLPSVGKEAVYSAVVHYAQQNCYDEAQNWLTSLEWDGVPRLTEWIHLALGVENNAYHRGIGAQWLRGMVSRIMQPGAQFDYVLMLVGGQNLGKTSFFRIIGGPFYKSYTGQVENKDFYLATRGAILVDLDEGATLYKSEAIKIKSIISEVVDEFRAPYDRVMKKYPRRFVFSLSTNDTEPFRDVTGNRRYWAIDIKKTVNFKWLEDNRDQLFAEAYHCYKNKIELPEVPMDEAMAIQEAHLPDDSWTDLVADEVRRSADYCEGNPDYSVTILEIFIKVFKDESLVRLDRRHEMRIGNIFRKELGLEKRRQMVDGEQKNRWYISEKKQAELKIKPAKKFTDSLDQLVDLLQDKQEPLEF